MKISHAAAGAALASSLVLLASCYPFIAPLPSGGTPQPSIQHVPYSGSFSYTVNTGSTPRDVYFIFTNPSTTADLSAAPAFVSASITVDGKSLPAPAPQALPSLSSAPQTMNDRVAEFNRDPKGHLLPGGPLAPQASLISAQPASLDSQGPSPPASQADFVMDIDQYGNAITASNVAATCKVVRKVTLPDGRVRSLSIWLANTTTKVPGAAALTALADNFLALSGSSDIYQWDTAAVGEPWAHMTSADYIDWDSNQTITILLADLNTAYPSSNGTYTVGFFWAKDNFKTITGSNQRIMFYIDATLYSTIVSGDPGFATSTWSTSDFWSKFVYSTLAHEFQHMIQFYQKQVVFNLSQGAETWIDEMCSMIMEDLVADKLNVEGPRGVPLVLGTTPDPTAGPTGIVDGRPPGFNANSYLPLVITSNYDLPEYYSVAYAFGAWLARNYGGATLLRRIVQSSQTDESAVVNAVIQSTGNQNESFATLLERWAASVLLSNSTTAPTGYQYNVGTWFTSSAGYESFNLGSMSFFNYTPSFSGAILSPTSPAPSTTRHSSNIYYEAAASLAGSRTWSITLPTGVLMNIVIR